MASAINIKKTKINGDVKIEGGFLRLGISHSEAG
jgi:hypothetical protein